MTSYIKNVRIIEIVMTDGSRSFHPQWLFLWIFWVGALRIPEGFKTYKEAKSYITKLEVSLKYIHEVKEVE